MGELYLMRHGQTTCNADGIIQGPRVDSELSSEGHAQADALAQAFVATELDAIYSSPLGRARQTAGTISDAQPENPGARIVPEMYEMDYGSFCGRRIDDVRDDISQILDAWQMGFIHQAFPEGESPVVTQHRIRRFAARLRDHALDADVAVVAHGRVNRILTATLVETSLAELERFPQDNANITHMTISLDGVELKRINDTTHLSQTSASFS